MEPEWHQDDKSIQPRQLPQFEVAGPQIDGEYRARAAKLVVSRVSIAALIVLGVVIVSLIPTAMRGQRSDFAKIEVKEEDRFAGRIQMRLHRLDRQREIKGWLFTTHAGETREGRPWPFTKESEARASGGKRNLEFVICEISLTNNNRKESFKVNPYAFVLTTDRGVSYKTDLTINSYRGRLKHGKLKPGQTKRGALVFKLPENEGLTSLEIMGSGGPVSRLVL